MYLCVPKYNVFYKYCSYEIMRICLTTGCLVDGKDRFLGGVPDLHCLSLRLAPLLLLPLLLLPLLLLLQLQLK